MTALRIIRRRARELAQAPDRHAYQHAVRAAFIELRDVLGWADTLRQAHRVERLLSRLAERGTQRDMFAA